MANSLLPVGQSLAFDPQYALNRLQANQHEPGISPAQADNGGLTQVAEQFETLFLQMVLKNMRAASDALTGDDGLFSSNQQLVFRDLYDSQMAQSMAHNSKTGLAEQIVRQFTPASERAAFSENSAEKLKLAVETVAPSSYQLLDLVFGGGAFNQPLQTPRATSAAGVGDSTSSE